MPRPGSRAAAVSAGSPTGRARLAGFSHGASALVAAWFAAGTIALLTGATAVVILLAVGLVAMAAGVLSGWLGLRGAHVEAVDTARLAVADDDLGWHVIAGGARPVHVTIRELAEPTAEVLAQGWVSAATTLNGIAPRRGLYRQVHVTCSSAGRMGLVRWRVRRTVDIVEV